MKKELEQALKEILLSTPKDKAKYENKKPSKIEKNQRWRLEKKGLKVGFVDLSI